jgi:uncharacterized protein YciI
VLQQILAVFISRGASWDHARGLEDQVGWDEHAAFVDARYAEGFVLLVGPLEGTDDVLMIVAASDEDDVRARLAADPWHRSNQLRIDCVAPWTLRLGSLPGPEMNAGSPPA